jgi:predicted lipoprotein with Yx(FWY)xxD motif
MSQLSLMAAAVLAAFVASGCSGGGAAPSAAIQSEPAEPAPTQSPAPSDSAAASESSAPAASSAGGGRGDYDYGTGTEPSPASEAPASGTVRVNTASGPLGTWLTGSGGLTLYTFKPDSANTSTCVDGCAEAWPPFIVSVGNALEAGDGVIGALSTFERPDGKLQVAYDGAPLYYFASDSGPGDTNGQGLGDAWFVAEP